MAGEATGRPLLPQTAQMQSFTFAPPTLAPRENQRNYVFVDEHNRHKRLKVMRACEGCRRRKIKCDAATTNAWPCAACIRLKLNCIPPTVSYDKDFTPSSHTFEIGRPQDYGAPGGPDDYQRHHQMQHHLSNEMAPAINHNVPGSYPDSIRMYQTAPYIEPQPPQDALQYAQIAPPSVAAQDLGYHTQQMYSQAPPPPATTLPPTMPPAEADPSWRSNGGSPNLTDALGELKIDHTAVAPYILNQKKSLAEAPAVEEYEIHLPQNTSQDHTVRIPLEMMPSEQQCLQYFDFFFENIHPYVPVLDRSYFFRQWHMDRNLISPLILEAIFACSSLMLEDPSQGEKWLALASKHEESFRDVPRLSTIQATLLLVKAREAVPKRGYFYRSWMTIVNLVAMAKDLELDQHYELHQMGKPCGSSISDCMTKTRAWQTLFILEIMIGAPQGRVDFGVNPDTVDFSIPPRPDTMSTQDPNALAEAQVSYQFSFFARVVKEVQRTTIMHGKLRKIRKDWAMDNDYVQHNHDIDAWMRDLPRDLQVVYPDDGSPPWIPSHFIANMHCYYHLAVIMHRRPQMHFLSESYDGLWKQHMVICYASAKNMCKLQEAIRDNYNFSGLLYMQRGISFTIYAVLTCTMLHLAAITSPDPELNSDSRDYFVRQMRILEQCTPLWPMPEMHAQVDALREAFSADVRKAFELKPSFPFGSPGAPHNSSPLADGYRPRIPVTDPSLEQPGQVNYSTHPLTPPISATDTDPKADSPVVQSLVMMAAGQRQPPQSAIQMQEPVQWNPTRIFDQWNAAFGTPPPSTASQSSPPLRVPSSGHAYELRTPVDSHPPSFPQQASVSPSTGQVPNMQAQLPPPVTYANQAAPFVSPAMWQDAVASSFQDGFKRKWDYSSTGFMDQGHLSKRSR